MSDEKTTLYNASVVELTLASGWYNLKTPVLLFRAKCKKSSKPPGDAAKVEEGRKRQRQQQQQQKKKSQVTLNPAFKGSIEDFFPEPV